MTVNLAVIELIRYVVLLAMFYLFYKSHVKSVELTNETVKCIKSIINDLATMAKELKTVNQDNSNEYIGSEPKRSGTDEADNKQDPQLKFTVEGSSPTFMEIGEQPEDFAPMLSKGIKTAVSFGEDVSE